MGHKWIFSNFETNIRFEVAEMANEKKVDGLNKMQPSLHSNFEKIINGPLKFCCV